MRVNWLNCCALVLLSSAFGANTNSKRLGRLRRRENEEAVVKNHDFPRIYTANVFFSPARLQSHSFIAELDVLDVAINEKNGDYATVTFMVHGQHELMHLKKLTSTGRSSEIKMELDEKKTQEYMIKAEPESNFAKDTTAKSGSYSTINGFTCYRDLAGMEQLMKDLVDQASTVPNLEVTLTDIGDSYLKTQNAAGGYDIWALNITGSGVKAQGSTTEKGIMFAMTGIHAREYAPPELAARFAESLINRYGHDADITAMLDHTEIHLVLHSNPDGRYEAETQPSLYRRKNMNGDPSQCWAGEWGVDLNRNFPFKWGLDSGSSSYPCSPVYRGEFPASEPEVKAIIDYVSSLFPEDQRKANPEEQIDEPYPQTAKGIFFDIHSYGEMIIWPWGHENRESANDFDLEGLVYKYRHFNGYEFSGPNMPGFLYEASGTTDDFSFGTLGAAGMTFEIGREFYEDCDYFTESIVPSNMLALVYAAKASSAPYILSKGPDVTNIDLSPSFMVNSASSILTVTVEVSDSAFSVGTFPTSQQTISSVQVFIDTHPYDGNSTSGLEMSGNFISDTETATLSLTLAQILQEITLPVLGRHTIYVQGMDSDGYTGPVTAAFFDIVDSGSTGQPDEDCVDSLESFVVDDDLVGTRNCDWLAINMKRFDYLCDLVEVGRRCPQTCMHCELFG